MFTPSGLYETKNGVTEKCFAFSIALGGMLTSHGGEYSLLCCIGALQFKLIKLTPRIGVLREKLVVTQTVRNLPVLYGTRKCTSVVARARH